MARKAGNPNWVKGYAPNPKGRPKGRYIFYPTIRWEKFVYYWMMCGNATQAAKRAGYSPKTATVIASQLWRKPGVQIALARLRRLISEKEQSLYKK
jgi:hypothetical protein